MSVEIKYNGETLETIEGGQYATIHTKGKTLGDDIRVEAANVGGGACSGKHYIEVDELPTENIDEEAVYKCGDSFHKWGKTFEDIIAHDESGVIYSLKELFEAADLGVTLTLHYAKTKPTENILRGEEGNIYYIEDENGVFLYGEADGVLVWQDISSTGEFPPITAAITDASQATEEGAYALLGIGWRNHIHPKGTLYIAENGTYDVAGKAGVSVDVRPIGTLEVTENGTYDVADKAEVSVYVPVPDGYIVPSGTMNITANGTHDVTNYASVNVYIRGVSDYYGEITIV